MYMRSVLYVLHSDSIFSQQLLNEIQPFSFLLMRSETTGSLAGCLLSKRGFAKKNKNKKRGKKESFGQLQKAKVEMKSSFHV